MAKRALQRIESELERIGLLLQHDAELPSLTTLAAGEPIAGSWWADPRCHELYDVMQQLEDRGGVLRAKVINGKLTYVHARLWPALLVIAQDSVAERARDLSRIAQRLRERVAQQGFVRADELRNEPFASSAELTKAIRELERKLLVHTDDVHTDSGAHAKVLTSWSKWAAEHGVAAGTQTVAAARAELDRAVEILCAGARRKAKVPW